MYPFKEGSFAPRNGWYVAAFSHEVGRQLLSRWILNEPVVMYRTEAGEPVALDGRCPHRNFPLGKSCLKGDEIQCGYHGITFGSDGQATHVPSQAHVPKRYRVKKYPIVEHGLWLFIWPGDPLLADTKLLPDIEAYDWGNPEFRFMPMHYFEVPGRYQLLNDNLLDLSHLAVLHASSIGIASMAETQDEHEVLENAIKSMRYMKKVPLSPFQQTQHQFDGLVDHNSGMDFHLPGFHAGLDETIIPADHPTRGGEKLEILRIFHGVTPGKTNTVNYFFAFGGVVTIEQLEQIRDVVVPPILEEDMMATREIEEMLTTLRYTPIELMLKSDATAVEGRRKLQAMMDKESALSMGVERVA